MAISINSVLPVLSAQEVGGIAPELVLQPGSVVNAQVLKVLSADLVRIAIDSLSIDVASEIPLQPGQSLQLAVTQTKDGGIRLAMVGQGGDVADAVTLSPEALVDAAVNRPAIVSKNVLTPVERAAVSAAAQAAVTEQDSLAPLFANLAAAVSSSNLPPKLREAIAQVLAQQTSLDQNLDGADIKTAFQKSGIFLEASLASGSLAPGGAPDLKAALIVLRQTLQSALGINSTTAPPVTPAAPQPAAPPSASTASPAPVSLPTVDAQEILLPQARLAAESLTPAVQAGQTPLALKLDAGPSAGATLNLLQEALQELGVSARVAATAAMPKDARGGDITFTNTPPPPIRGAPPAAQPIASPTIAPHAPLEATAHHLLDDTDAAIARQTLLQVASLPDRIDNAAPKVDATLPRWHFEIPFVTPQGTAMAQFEISRDGGEQEVEAAKRVWRARFSLDVEPAGPVHALISLTGDKTSVRIWAERPATAAQLRAGAPQLSEALSRAELQPGDIVIRDGAPPQAVPAARAGHFLDRAL
ncbi:flagellar hook-length control protein FliK [Bradyrhizobium sp. CCBAU 051011]|uniref:flagellar hook-length control protein FliK n=1 Tax=Bradyrhizobium sp. CCBAU 051011 TaxID=858422 RepID=UPI001373ADC4|nr:flagellar hook-length control protein FliK [Bradyrhizobium sp. CCBAU 051011]QHO77498.1 flagellar hook-length control protein FliK [Bradyrhizobium sp. CCBAU 051011]